MYHYRDTKTIPIKIVLASLLSTLTQGGKFYSSVIWRKNFPTGQDK